MDFIRYELMPALFRMRRSFGSERITDPERAVRASAAPYLDRIPRGGRVAVAVGSRGINHTARLTKTAVELIREAGASPYIIPAMGSHGGATAEGQAEILAGYGITEETMGAPVLSAMETVVLGTTPSGMPVHADKNAAGMDGVIMLNRVKPHTDFHGRIESGLVKQLAVGLGKHAGAIEIHRRGTRGLETEIPAAARIILEHFNILFGIAVLENADDSTAHIECVPAEDFFRREPELLEMARPLLPALPAQAMDVLVISEMGKNISGTGIDPNVVGRYLIRGMKDDVPGAAYRIVVLSLTPESHGNAIGMGIADVITKNMCDGIDLDATYTNTATSGFLERGFTPVVAENDRAAICLALMSANRLVTAENARLMFIRNTLDLGEYVVSKALLPELTARPDMALIGPYTPDFGADGTLRGLWD